MESIRFISSTNVQPENQIDHLTKIDLTPCDVQCILVGPIQKGILFCKPTPDYEQGLINKKQSSNLIEHLRSSYQLTLNIFYPLAGRLAVTENEDNTTSFSIDCNGAGAEFVHAAADSVTVADILDLLYVPDSIIYSLFSMNGVVNYDGRSKPLVAVQVTELADGVFIGLTMNHSAGDGTCFWKFFNIWSEISRSGCAKTSPIFGREFLHGIIDLPVRVPHFQEPNPEEKLLQPTEPLLQRVFHFRREKISELKSKANAQMGTSKISSLQALMAHLWVSITRSRRLVFCTSDDQETKYIVIVGVRQRLEPPLADEYVGNAVLFGWASATVGDMLHGGLGFAAIELNRMIASQTKQEARKFLKEWTEKPHLLRINSVTTDGNNNLGTGSSPRFDVYGNDFGWGRPVAVRSGAGNKFDGKLTVFEGEEAGSIDFEACLSPQTLQALAEDAEFMDSVTV